MKLRRYVAVVLAMAMLLSFAGCGSKEGAVYVQSVADLMNLGGIAPGDHFLGLVVSEHVTKIEKDSDKAVKELLVQEGVDVKEGQELFSYDTDELQLNYDKKSLELEQLKASIENYTEQIADLEADSKRVSAADKLQYTIQIQSMQVDLKEAELNLPRHMAEHVYMFPGSSVPIRIRTVPWMMGAVSGRST